MKHRRNFLKFAGTMAMLGATNALFAQSNSTQHNNKNSGKGVLIQTLNNGVKMPIVGLGTYGLWNQECEKAIEDALSVGYRAFDTAQMYNNEKEVGNGIRGSEFKREELFITTKLSSGTSYEATKKSIESSLKNLGLDYIDLLLIHSPYNEAKEMYKAMEEFYKAGQLKAIGISNFDTKAYLDFIKTCDIIPQINQVQVHVFYQRESLQEALAKNGTIMQAWSPFAKGKNDFFKNPTLLEIGKKYGKTPAQVGLRYLVERDINVIPKSSKIERMRENLNIFDFTLSAEDLEKIKKLDGGKSLFGWDS